MRKALGATALGLAALIPIATAAGQSCTSGIELHFCGSTEVSASPGVSGRTVVIVSALTASAFTAIRASHRGQSLSSAGSRTFEPARLPGFLVRFVPTTQFAGRRINRPPRVTVPLQNVGGGEVPVNSFGGKRGDDHGDDEDDDHDGCNGGSSYTSSNSGCGDDDDDDDDHDGCNGGSSYTSSNSGCGDDDDDDDDDGDGCHGGSSYTSSNSGCDDDDDDDDDDGDGCHSGSSYTASNSGCDDDDDDDDDCHMGSSSPFGTSWQAQHGDDDEDDDDCVPPPPSTTVPEPASLVLLGTGMLGIAGVTRWSRRRSGIG